MSKNLTLPSHPTNNDVLNQYGIDVGPTSVTLSQHSANIGLMYLDDCDSCNKVCDNYCISGNFGVFKF